MKRKPYPSSPAILQQLQKGVACHQAGDFSGAEDAYRQVLQLEPDNPDALHLLGLLAHQSGRHQPAADLMDRAIRANPANPHFYNNCGEAYRAQGKYDAALARYRKALALDRDYPEAHNNLGVTLEHQGKVDQAVAHYRRALAVKPDYAEAHNNLGSMLHRQGKLEAAGRHLEKAVAAKPGFVQALINLGALLRDRDRPEESLACYERASAVDPDNAEAQNEKGNTLLQLGRFRDAAACYQGMLARGWNSPAAHSNLGNALHGMHRFREAEESYRTALSLDPDYLQARKNLAIALRDQGLLEQAIAQFEQALALAPEDPEAHFGIAFASLLGGDFERGWREYEWRWKTDDPFSPRRKFKRPRWSGQDLAGRTILLHAEQGLGDAIQFIRYAPLVAQRGARVIVECPAPLAPLIRGMAGVSEVVAQGDKPPSYDVHCPLMSLPLLFGTTQGNIPAQVPYLAPDAERVSAWGEILAADGAGLKVGLAWKGSARHANDRNRSCPPEAFSPLADLPGVRFHSLQKDPGDAVPPGMRLADHSAALADFADTAALIARLDLVIAVDTAVAHLAGALGKPVWTLLARAPDWRWLLGREDSPWYPTMRLFRQREPGDWQEVMARVKNGLIAETGASSTAAPLRENERGRAAPLGRDLPRP